MTKTEAIRKIRAIGMKAHFNVYDEFVVNHPNGNAATAYFTDDADDAFETAKAMLKEFESKH